jgi:hypothetical protein
MKTALTYGFLLALGGFLLNLVLFLAGLQSDAAKLRAGQGIGLAAGVVLATILIVLAIRACRRATPNSEAFTYGNALGAGFLTQVFASLFGLGFVYLYVAVINPQLTDAVVQLQLDKLQARGLGGEQLDRAEHIIRMFSGPLAMTVSSFAFSLIIGTLIALIVAWFLKREAAEPPLGV